MVGRSRVMRQQNFPNQNMDGSDLFSVKCEAC